MHATKKLPLTPFQVRQAAALAVCDHRCVVRFLVGLPVRSTTAARVRSALEQLGLGAQMPADAAPADAGRAD